MAAGRAHELDDVLGRVQGEGPPGAPNDRAAEDAAVVAREGNEITGLAHAGDQFD